jgi:dTDP-4-amino-4,6-dideoxygalactose transaminase
VLPFLRTTLPRPSEFLPFLEASYASGRFSNFGPCASRLERELTERFGDGKRQAVLVCSCTTGLSLTLLALGVHGRVVIPSFTFPATAHAVLAARCEPFFIDVHPQTWELAPEALEHCLASVPDVGAVLHVRAFGFCRDLSPVEQICRQAGVPLVVDAAAAFGGRLAAGQTVGMQGDAEVFSFHATKVFGIGEGGVVFASEALAESIRRASNFGLHDGSVVQAGANGKLSEFSAAVGLVVLRRFDAAIERRQAVASRYAETFLGRSDLDLPTDVGFAPWQTFPVCLTGSQDGDSATLAMRDRGVEVRRYYSPPLHRTPFFARDVMESLGISEGLSRRMICLPIYSDMTHLEQEAVISAALSVLNA